MVPSSKYLTTSPRPSVRSSSGRRDNLSPATRRGPSCARLSLRSRLILSFLASSSLASLVHQRSHRASPACVAFFACSLGDISARRRRVCRVATAVASCSPVDLSARRVSRLFTCSSQSRPLSRVVVLCWLYSIMSRSKASWDNQTSKLFINLCLQQVQEGERRGSSMTKIAWKFIEQRFNQCTSRGYCRAQLKNKYDTLRKDWQLWNKLKNSETGLGWDDEKGLIVANNEWWERMKLENLGVEKFRFRGLQFSDELDCLFGNVAATGLHHWAPSSTVLEPVYEQVYGDADACVDLEEGFGDSDELVENPTGCSYGLHRVTFGSSQGGSGNVSSVKGKVPVSAGSSLGIKKAGGGKKKGKGPATHLIAEALHDLVGMRKSAMEHATRVAQPPSPSAAIPSASTIIAHMLTVDQLMENIDLFVRSMDVMRSPETRELYWSIKDNVNLLLPFLHRQCYGGRM